MKFKGTCVRAGARMQVPLKSIMHYPQRAFHCIKILHGMHYIMKHCTWGIMPVKMHNCVESLNNGQILKNIQKVTSL